jgi:MFS family permease
MAPPRCWGKDLIYVLILSLGSLTFGYIVAFPSPADRILPDIFGADVDHYRPVFNSIASLTAIVGPFAVNFLLSPRWQLGRRLTCFIIAVSGCAFWSLQLLASEIPKEHRPILALFGRVSLGITMGCFSALMPMYVVELAPPSLTGIFGTFPQIFIASGVSFCYLVGFAPKNTSSEFSFSPWWILIGCGAGIDALLSVLIWFVPESPAIIQEQNRTANESGETLCSRKWFRWMIIAAAFGFFQQFTGINAIVTDVTTIFTGIVPGEELGYVPFWVSIAQIIACIGSGPLINKIGRDRVWMLSFAICGMADLGYAITNYDSETRMGPKELQIVILFLHLLGFGLGAGPIAWFIVPEMFPTIVRPHAVVVAAVSNWIWSSIVIAGWSVMSKSGIRVSKFSAFLFFAIISMGGILFGKWYVRNPEIEEEQLTKDLFEDLVST